MRPGEDFAAFEKRKADEVAAVLVEFQGRRKKTLLWHNFKSTFHRAGYDLKWNRFVRYFWGGQFLTAISHLGFGDRWGDGYRHEYATFYGLGPLVIMDGPHPAMLKRIEEINMEIPPARLPAKADGFTVPVPPPPSQNCNKFTPYD